MNIVKKIINTVNIWVEDNILVLFSEIKLSFFPPLMIYAAAGISGMTSIVGIFFIKERLGLSAEFLAALGFWAGLPWALKMPVGHLVDLIWKWKSLLVFFGALLIGISLTIMIFLLGQTNEMEEIMSLNRWFVLSALLAPIGYVLQDVVADAMTVEAVPRFKTDGDLFDPMVIKSMHTTMQTLGRVAIVGGGILVSILNIILLKDVSLLNEGEKALAYMSIYKIALIIPIISILGVVFAFILKKIEFKKMLKKGISSERANRLSNPNENIKTDVNWWILGGGIGFSVISVIVGLAQLKFGQELIFVLSMLVIFFLINKITLEIDKDSKKVLIGTAIIIFVFRAVPTPGAGSTWWMIDELLFDQQFLAKLSLIASVLALFGMFLFRRFMAKHSISYVITFLTIAATLLSIPTIGMYFGLHEWTSKITNGVIDARFIAVVDTALESPLGQIAMIPMLAWIANSAPKNLKATFFAIMASFTNLALSASALGTKYLNQIFLVSREIRDSVTNKIISPADYSELGLLLITVTSLGFFLPLFSIFLVRKMKFQSA